MDSIIADRTGALRGKTPASRRQVSLRCNKNWAPNSYSHLGWSGSRREIPIFRDVALAPRFRPPPGSRVRPRIGHASARTTVADDFPDFIFSEALTVFHLYSYAVLILRPGSGPIGPDRSSGASGLDENREIVASATVVCVVNTII